MIRYPIGIQTFEEIINGGYAYVDKTKLVYDLVNSGKYYFLSRPRRFGKSLLVSTLEAYFRGKKELFKGLAIENLEKDWECYPVLHLDLNSRNYVDDNALIAELHKHLDFWEDEYGIENPGALSPEDRLSRLLVQLNKKTGKGIVFLVDEYDKPVLSAIDNEDLSASYRGILKAFYSVLKTYDKYIKFGFLTGVTKLGKVSVFSDLNNPTDISMDKEFQSICGISEEELRNNFGDEIADMAQENGMSVDECYATMGEMYDGYHFYPNGVGMYNPFSVLNALRSKNFGSYWFETGTPTGLVLALRSCKEDISSLNNISVSPNSIKAIESYKTSIIPLLYQSGYLTIKGTEDDGFLTLGFPNREVEDGFINQLLPLYSSFNEQEKDNLIRKLRKALRQGDLETFFEEMKTYLAGMYYEFFKNEEQTFQSVFYIIGTLIGNGTRPELHTNRGRIDLLVQTKDYIYIFEFKHDGTPEEALKQIHEKGYADQFKTDSRKKFLVGVNFDSQLRNIPEDGWKVEEIS